MVSATSKTEELPPRARRIRILLIGHVLAGGTTSACAENTQDGKVISAMRRNYLRVRGEYVGGSNTFTMWWELPPRARRIHLAGSCGAFHCGTTSACAENTTYDRRN